MFQTAFKESPQKEMTSIPISKATRGILKASLKPEETWDSGLSRILTDYSRAQGIKTETSDKLREELRQAQRDARDSRFNEDNARRELEIAGRLIKERNLEIKRLRLAISDLSKTPQVQDDAQVLPGGLALVMFVLFKWKEDREKLLRRIKELKEETARMRKGIETLAGEPQETESFEGLGDKLKLLEN